MMNSPAAFVGMLKCCVDVTCNQTSERLESLHFNNWDRCVAADAKSSDSLSQGACTECSFE